MPLRLRLALLFALATAVAVAVAGLAFVLQLRVSVEASLDPGLRAQARGGGRRADAGDGAGPCREGATSRSSPPTGGRGLPGAGTRAVLEPGAAGAGPRPARCRSRPRSAGTARRVPGRRDAAAARAGPRAVGDRDRRRRRRGGTGRAGAAARRPPAVLLAGVGRVAAGRGGAAAGGADAPAGRGDQRPGPRTGGCAVPATRDEIAALGTTMNALLARLQEALRASAGSSPTPGTSCAHRWRSCARSSSWPAGRAVAARTLVEAVTQAGEETDRLIRLAEDLLLLARADNHQPFLRPARCRCPTLLAAAVRGARRAGRRARRRPSPSTPPPSCTSTPTRTGSGRPWTTCSTTPPATPRAGASSSSRAYARPGRSRSRSPTAGRASPGLPAHAFERFHRAESGAQPRRRRRGSGAVDRPGHRPGARRGRGRGQPDRRRRGGDDRASREPAL